MVGLLGTEGKPRLCGDTGVKNPGKKLQMDFTAGPVATTACEPLQVAHLVCGSPRRLGRGTRGWGTPLWCLHGAQGRGWGWCGPGFVGRQGRKKDEVTAEQCCRM